MTNPLDELHSRDKTSLYEQQCGFSMQFSFQYFFHLMDDLFPLILQFLLCGYRHVEGRMDRQMDRIMDRQTK